MEPSLSISARSPIVPRPKTYSPSSSTNHSLNCGLILMLVRYNSACAHLIITMIFKTRTPFGVALDMFLNAIVPIEDTEVTPIREARGRVLTSQIIAPRDEPNYRRAAMDGYAVIADDTLGASERSPVALKIGDDVRRGVVSRVHTGSKMPDQADAVVMVEDVERLDDVAEIRAQTHPFENVGLKGEDVRRGEQLFHPGHRLRPCLLYTSDAADEEDSVDLGGRR